MTWNWEELTAPDFSRAVEATKGVCVVPVGVVEKHGGQLPLGSDVFIARAIAQRAAAIEPAVIFPSYYFAQTQETRSRPGAITIPRTMQMDLLEMVCSEIARNGMKKIILLNGHGGNEAFLPYFGSSMLERRREFTIYVVRISDWWDAAANDPQWKKMMQSPFDFHAGEMETSMNMAIRPDLVKMQDITAPAVPLDQLSHLPTCYTPIWWNAKFPDQYAGDATHATREKGEFLLQRATQLVANVIKAVRADSVTRKLEDEFFAQCQHG